MKILIRHRVHNRYLDQQNQWVTKPELARDFVQGDRAIAHASAMGLRDIDLTYHFPNPAYNFNTPLDAFGHRASEGELMAGQSKRHFARLQTFRCSPDVSVSDLAKPCNIGEINVLKWAFKELLVTVAR